MPINQPSNQIRLTNVSLVRLKKGKKRFEIACYKNKVLEYRSGQEDDLDNVLQIRNVFLSVSRGQTAPAADLEKAFGKGTKLDEIIQEILHKGELQVGDKERGAQKERLEKEIIDMVAGKVVDPRTKRVYTGSIIGKALDQLTTLSAQNKTEPSAQEKDASQKDSEQGRQEITNRTQHDPKPMWSGVVTTKNAKSQALDAIKALIAWQPIPVARARMRLRITCPTGLLKQVTKHNKESGETRTEIENHRTLKDQILEGIEQIEAQDTFGSDWQVTGFVEPGALRTLGELLANESKGRGRIEVLDTAVTHESEFG